MNDENATTKRRSKDSMFTSLFSEKEYVLQLYKELHPEDKDVTEDDIDITTIRSVIVNTLYNDLGFMVRDTFVLLLEAQSIWNANITLRLFFYLAETYKRYLKDTVQSELSDSLVKLPKPDLYVVYTGDRKIPGIVSLKDTYFSGDAPIDLEVKVLSSIDGTITGQYISFCRIFDEQRKKHGNRIECAKETMRICLERNILAGFIRKHEKEVITMMEELFDEDILTEQYLRAQEHRMKDIWLAEGEEIGLKKGIERGIEKGIAEGIEKGIAEGIEKGRNDLIKQLIKAGFSKEQIANALNTN